MYDVRNPVGVRSYVRGYVCARLVFAPNAYVTLAGSGAPVARAGVFFHPLSRRVFELNSDLPNVNAFSVVSFFCPLR